MNGKEWEEEDALSDEELRNREEAREAKRDIKTPRILNLTQHTATAEQIGEGVFDLDNKHVEELKALLTFDVVPSAQDLYERAYKIGELALQIKNALYPGGDTGYGEEVRCMIGGAPYFTSTLENVLRSFGFTPVYAFSLRVSEEKEIDGKVIKKQVFKHLGFVEVKE